MEDHGGPFHFIFFNISKLLSF